MPWTRQLGAWNRVWAGRLARVSLVRTRFCGQSISVPSRKSEGGCTVGDQGQEQMKALLERSPLRQPLKEAALPPRLKAYLLAITTLSQANRDKE